MTKGFERKLARALMGVVMAAGVSGLAWADATETTSLDTVVRVEGVRTMGDEVQGRIVNQTGDQLEDVRLLVSDQFLWRNERHPGEDSPSEAHAVTVPGPIPPHGTATFSFRRPSPLPDRRDGQFVTDVEPVEAGAPTLGTHAEPPPSSRFVLGGRRLRACAVVGLGLFCRRR
jgi:hypothetical protein